jgi:Tfp pilus assembly protein PilO
VNRRNLILFALVALAGSVYGFWHYGLEPKRKELAKLDSAITEQEKTRDAANAQAAQYQKAKEAYEANYAKVVAVGKAVPADDDVRSLLVQVESAARTDKVDFRLISVGGGTTAAATPPVAGEEPKTPGAQVVPGSDISTLPFSFAFTGNYFNLADFLGTVERFVTVRNAAGVPDGRLMLLTSFSLKPDSRTGWPHLRAEVGATSYVAPPGTALPKAGDAATATGQDAAGTTPAPEGSSTPTTPTTATATGAVR